MMKKVLQSLILLLGALMLPATAYAQQRLYGDVNGDNEVNIADINTVIGVILDGAAVTPAADVNSDGEINIADINAVIDIILGGQPATELKSDVFLLTADYNDVITDADTVSFTLSSTVPVAKRPVMGNVVLSTADCTPFPDGIMARVTGIVPVSGGLRYNCVQVGLDDVFDQLFIDVEIEAATDSTSANSPSLHAPARTTITAELWNATFDGNFSGGGVTANLHARDRSTIRVTARKTRNTPWYFNIDVRNELTSNFNMSAVSTADFYRSFDIGSLTVGRIPILYIYGVPVLFLTPQLTLKGYVEESGEVRLDYSGHFNRTDVSSYTYSDGQWNITSDNSNDGCTDVAQISMNGYAGVGLIPGLKFALNGTRNGVGVNVSAGVRERMDFVFDATLFEGGRLYDACRDSYCSTTMPWQVSLYASWSVFGHAGEASTPPLLSGEPKIMEDRYLFPLFTKPEYKKGNPETTAIISTTSSRRVLLPTTVGLRLFDENDNQLKSWQQGYSTTELDNEQHVTSFTGLQKDKTYHVRPTVTVMGFTIEASPLASFKIDQEEEDEEGDWVDQGLPSGTIWATRNVGASAPEDYGDYFAWGETAPKNCYDWSTYKWYQSYQDANGAYHSGYTKYCTDYGYGLDGFVDNKTELDLSDDAAYAHYPGGRMPSLEQIQELIDKRNCTWQWTQRNGVKGHLVTGPNGNTIFLPAAGGRWDESLRDVGKRGHYWSPTLCSILPISACTLNFDKGWVEWQDNLGNLRFIGYTVRAVRVSQN
ncbi:MAG: hypothetical protein IJ879_05530 [Muribaculaceae bacterium]|nr:hypothetical protein [Muribaculaceae bacterium]